MHRSLYVLLLCIWSTALTADTDPREHLVEISLKDLNAQLIREPSGTATSPAIVDPMPCDLCPGRALIPNSAPDSGSSHSPTSSLHRLHREIIEQGWPHDNSHLVEDSLSRAADGH